MIRYWHHNHAGVWPLTLPPLLQPGSDTAGSAAGRGEKHAIIAHFDDRAVVENNASLAQHDAVARTSRFELCQIIDVEAVSEIEGVGTDQLDLSQWRGVVDPYPIANELYLTRHRLLSGLAAAREGGRALPLAEVFEQGAGAHL